MGRRLITRVMVTPPPGTSDAGFLVLGPDDDVPDWAAEQIGEHAFEPASGKPELDGPPPKDGKGSGKAAWVEYAAASDVAVDKEATRDDIIAALDAAGIPTE